MKQIFLIGLAMLVMMGCSKKKEYTAPSLVELLKEKDPKMRYYAARELGHFGAQAAEVVPPLTEALKDEDKKVRMGAAYALGEIGPDAKSALPPLEETLRDPDMEVRKAADYAIKKVREISSQGQQESQTNKRKHKRKLPKPQK